jgi:hypothetical protein
MMNEPTRQQTSRRGFGAAFLAAMHDWRQRQAAREIEYYQHLIHNPRVHEGWLSVGRPAAQPAHPQSRSSGLGLEQPSSARESPNAHKGSGSRK